MATATADYNLLSWPDIRKLATERGIENVNLQSRGQITEKLMAQDRGEEPPSEVKAREEAVKVEAVKEKAMPEPEQTTAPKKSIVEKVGPSEESTSAYETALDYVGHMHIQSRNTIKQYVDELRLQVEVLRRNG